MQLSPKEALSQLAKVKTPYVTLFQHGSLEVEIYRPEMVDNQSPHSRDEIYVVIAGNGTFFLEGERISFGPGDFLFAPAGAVHRFIDFSDDFSTWVFFYGPEGGELVT